MGIYSKLFKLDDNFDYIVIQNGYSNRIESEWIEKIEKDFYKEYPKSTTKIVCIGDKQFNNTKCHDIYEKIKSCDLWSSNGVITESNNIGDALDISKRLMEYEFCACYTKENLYEFKILDICNLKVLILFYDTEGG